MCCEPIIFVPAEFWLLVLHVGMKTDFLLVLVAAEFLWVN